MRYLSLVEVLRLHTALIASSGGSSGLRDLGRVQSALAQPQMTFDEVELYPTVVAKAAALGFSLIQGHPFVDGNKRVGHAAMEAFLMLNGLEIDASVDEQEKTILELASGKLAREDFVRWLEQHTRVREMPAQQV